MTLTLVIEVMDLVTNLVGLLLKLLALHRRRTLPRNGATEQGRFTFTGAVGTNTTVGRVKKVPPGGRACDSAGWR